MTDWILKGRDSLRGRANYYVWSLKMRMILRAEGLWTMTEEPQPPQSFPATIDGEEVKDLAQLEHKKAVACHLIIASVADHLLPVVADFSDPALAWRALKTHLSWGSRSHVLSLMRQLHNLKLREGASMQDYLLEADKLRNMLRSMGEEISDGELNQIVLDGLPRSYEPTIVALSFLDAPMTFETLFSKLLSGYQRRELRNRLHGDAASFSQQASLTTGWDHWRRALEVLKMEQGDEFALRKFNPCAYGYEQGVAPREVLTSDPDGCSFVHIDVECWSFALYADGACAGNGTPRARASVGVYSTPDSYYNRGYVLPVHAPHTSQSAEIHSAIAALEVARAIVKERWERVPLPDNCHDFTHVLLVMDSSYVVQAMTEWMRKWRVNGFRNAQREPVANQKALMRLDNEIRGLFEEHHIIVRFWLVPRIHNAGADRMAAHALRENTFIGVELNSDLYEMTERFAQQW